jgi:hypothetical protein
VADSPKAPSTTKSPNAAKTDQSKARRGSGGDSTGSTRPPAPQKPRRGSEPAKSSPADGGPKTPAPKAKEAKADDTKADDTKADDAKADDTKAASKLDAAPVAAVSEADAEAVLVDEPTPAPKSRRFSRRASSASTATAAISTPLPTTPTPTPTPAPIVGPVVTTGATTGVVRSDRHYRQTVTKVDLWSVTKLSLCFYLSAMFVTVVALVALWIIADAAGIIHSVEKFLGDLLSAKNFHFLSATVLRGAIVVGLVVVALQVVITVIAASFYNIFAELFGGVEITVKEEVTAE